MLIPMLCDMIFTLAGQPAGYWLHPEIAHEANPVSRFFLDTWLVCFYFYVLHVFLGNILVCINSSSEVRFHDRFLFYVR